MNRPIHSYVDQQGKFIIPDGSGFIIISSNEGVSLTISRTYISAVNKSIIHFNTHQEDLVAENFYFVAGEPFTNSTGKTFYFNRMLSDAPEEDRLLAYIDKEQNEVVELSVSDIYPILDTNEIYLKYSNCFGSFFAIAPLFRDDTNTSQKKQAAIHGYHYKSINRLFNKYRKIQNIFQLNREWYGQQLVQKYGKETYHEDVKQIMRHLILNIYNSQRPIYEYPLKETCLQLRAVCEALNFNQIPSKSAVIREVIRLHKNKELFHD